MTAQVIPVRTMEPVQTESTDSTAAVRKGLMERDVKKVTVSNTLHEKNSFLCTCVKGYTGSTCQTGKTTITLEQSSK